MSAKSKIQWTDVTWNPTRGCTRVSEGCRNCYAMRQAHRFSGAGAPYHGLTKLTKQGPDWTGKIRLVPEMLEAPLHWRKPSRIFVDSMSDLFHPDVPFEFIDRVFAVMVMAGQHIYQVLTKRPERMKEYFGIGRDALLKNWYRATDKLNMEDKWYAKVIGTFRSVDGPPLFPLPNVHLGTSCENQETADERIPLLLQTPAAVHFISAEPLLGPIDLDRAFEQTTESVFPGQYHHREPVDWVIVGGESGPGARPCYLADIRSIVAQCKRARIPAFVKQLGAFPIEDYPDMRKPLELKDKKGGNPSEWPEDLRVRQYPT